MQYRFESRVDASGNMIVANNMMQSYKLNSLACNVTNHQNTSSDYMWKCLGPAYSNYAAGIEAVDSIRNQGRIIAISQNPNNIDDILCSGVSGGIWKTDNGGATWRNVTDDDGFSYIGYSSIERSSIYSNWIFASSLCGNPGPYALLAITNLPNSGGIIMSTDNGETWIEIQSVNCIPNANSFLYPGVLSLELGTNSSPNVQNNIGTINP